VGSIAVANVHIQKKLLQKYFTFREFMIIYINSVNGELHNLKNRDSLIRDDNEESHKNISATIRSL
jgi:hypothetical protein